MVGVSFVLWRVFFWLVEFRLFVCLGFFVVSFCFVFVFALLTPAELNQLRKEVFLR